MAGVILQQLWQMGDGRCIDFFIASYSLLPSVENVEVLLDAPVRPHHPVEITLGGSSFSKDFRQRVPRRSFPTAPLMGCSRRPVTYGFSWPAGSKPPDLREAWAEWIQHAEDALCAVFDIVGQEREQYVGRAKGMRVIRRGVRQPDKREREHAASAPGLVQEWRQWHALFSHAVAILSREQPLQVRGCQELEAVKQRLLVLSQSQQVQWPQQLAAPACLAAELRPSVASLQLAQQAVDTIQAQCRSEEKLWAKQRSESWRSRAQEIPLGGGRQAHSFSQRPEGKSRCATLGDMPVTGEQAVQAVLAEWKPRWQNPRHMLEPPLTWPDDLEPLPPLTLQRLDGALASYPPLVGLGADDLHPRSILLLPEEFRV